MPSHVLVRDATVDDAGAIAAVQIAAWRAACAGVMTAQYLAALDQHEFAANWHETLTTAGSGGGSDGHRVTADMGGVPVVELRYSRPVLDA